MYRSMIPRALAAAAVAVLALTLSTSGAGAAPLVDAEIDAGTVSPVPLPTDLTVDATVDPTGDPALCVGVTVAGTPAGGCAPGGGLPVPLPTGDTGGLPGADALGPAAVCLTVPEACVAQATAPLTALTGALPAAPVAGLPLAPLAPVGALPGLLGGGATVDACASIGVLADARGCSGSSGGDGSGDAGGGGGDGSGAAKAGLAFTGGETGLLAALGSVLLALGAVIRRLARPGVRV